jgi:hypothetical protein
VMPVAVVGRHVSHPALLVHVERKPGTQNR